MGKTPRSWVIADDFYQAIDEIFARGWTLHMHKQGDVFTEPSALRPAHGKYWAGIDDAHGVRLAGAFRETMFQAVVKAERAALDSVAKRKQ